MRQETRDETRDDARKTMKDVEMRLNYEIKKSWRKRLKENEQFCQNRARGNRAKGQSRKERNRKRSLKKEPEKEQRKKEIATDIGKNGEKSYLGNVKRKDARSEKKCREQCIYGDVGS